MDVTQFTASLSADAPPAGLTPLLKALWLVAKGEWHAAHALAQDDPSAEGSWVHAHLHRVEGDLANAGYWYSRAGREASSLSLEAERVEIVGALG